MSVATSVLEGPGNNSSLGACGAQADIQGLERSISHPIFFWKRGSEKLGDGLAGGRLRFDPGYTAPKIAPSYFGLGRP